MVSPYDSAHFSARAGNTSSAHRNHGTAPQPARKPLAMRKYRISSLLSDGQIRTSDQIGPAMPIFESAFSAFAHGTLISTTQGQVAVEDLEPGMKLQTVDQGPMQLLWVGAMTLMPRSERFPEGSSLTRIMADSFGFGRPQADIMAGPGARFLLRPSGHAERYGNERALTPAAQMVDGFNAIRITPPTPVTVYHLCLRRHAIITAGGMEAESFHPGPGFERNMGPNMLSLFLSFFPHIKQARDFGPLAHERLPLSGVDNPAEMA
ncbi:hypothetical protein A3731_17740 [Roseovarius sp. HI0049]|nr:hypothetical protein A3731_17740 [Roseovarius sp. HI0049]